MKGIILAGGLGTRLYPITRVINKHVLPIGNKPIIYYPIQTLLNSGIRELGIVTGPPHGDQIKDIVNYYPSRNKLEITFINQPAPLGMSEAIGRCEGFANSEPIIVVTGDNIFGSNFRKEVQTFLGGATAFLRKAKDPHRHGVPVYDNNGHLERIIEKPTKPTGNWVVTCPYLFDTQVFKLINKLEPSEHGELEITDLLSQYIQNNNLKLTKRDDFWLDVGTFDSFFEATQRFTA
ncbi:NTP transferase domain-containing protein [Patescibacteria group bacterium]|nr:NTP transferase domain-containing protein [Patescibacteria group bacterium]MBU1868094.1 NTP transferase domain-containing protein [Patescibacteria group bacterium]